MADRVSIQSLTGQLLRWLVVLATVALLIGVVISRWDTLSQTELQLSAPWLAPASLVSLLATLMLVLSWRQLLAAYDDSARSRQSRPIPLRQAMRIWSFSQTTRYIPTGLVPIAARAWLVTPARTSRVVAAMSVIVETAALLGWGALAAAIWAPGDWIHPVLRWLLGAAALAGLVTLPYTLGGVRLKGRNRITRAVSKSIVALLGRLGVKEELRESLAEGLLVANRFGVWKAASLYGSAVGARLVSFALLAAVILPLGNTADATSTASDLWLVVGAGAASLVIGMVGITPAGLGVRETVLATLLTARFGLGDALAYSVALRAWEIALELLFLAVAAYLGRGGRAVQPGGTAQPEGTAQS